MEGLWSAGGRRLRAGAAIAGIAAVSVLGSPWVASGLAQAGGADKPRPATFGDCPHLNSGVHNGYDCEAEETERPT